MFINRILLLSIISVVLIISCEKKNAPLKDFSKINFDVSTNSNQDIIYIADYDLDGYKEIFEFIPDIEGNITYNATTYYMMNIYKITNNHKFVLYSTTNDLPPYLGDYFWDSNILIKINDLNHNGIPEIYLAEFCFGSDIQTIAIIEKDKNNKYHLVYHYESDYPKFIDLDNNDIAEFYDTVGDATSVKEPYVNTPFAFFIFTNNKYKYSKEITKIGIKWIISNRIANINTITEYSYFHYQSFISLYLMGSLTNELYLFLTSNWNYLTNNTNDFKYFNISIELNDYYSNLLSYTNYYNKIYSKIESNS